MIQIRRDKFYRNSSEMYGGLVNMLLSLPLWMRNTIAIEIGSFIGESANILSLFFKKVVCIDPQGDDVFSGYKSDDIKRMFGKNTVQRNIRIILKRAEDAVEEFAQGSVGFVYVDGGHVYPCVHQDIINYYPKIMDGGYIGGHDYDNGIELCQGVKQAVDEIFGEPDYCFEDWSWLVKKVPGRTTIEG